MHCSVSNLAKRGKVSDGAVLKLRKTAAARRSREFRQRERGRIPHKNEFLRMKLNMLKKVSTRKVGELKFTPWKVREIFLLWCVRSGMSRSSLAGSLSSVIEPVSRSFLGLNRWVSFRMCRIQVADYKSFTMNRSVCLSLICDSTEFRLWNAIDKVIADEIMVSCRTLRDEYGEKLQIAPKLSRMRTKCHADVAKFPII